MNHRFTIFFAFTILVGTQASRAQNFYDDFNSFVLKSGWTWTREDRPSWQLTGSEMQITTQLGALNGSFYNNVKNLLLQDAPSTRFRLETKVTFSPELKFHNAGLLYYIDDDNYIRVSRGINDSTSGIWMEYEVNANTMFIPLDGVTDTVVYLRLSRADNGVTFHASYSVDGAQWNFFAEKDIVFPSGLSKVGLQAANGDGTLATTNRIPARFDYFSVDVVTGIERTSPVSSSMHIDEFYPNPTFGDEVSMVVSDAAGRLEISVIDLLGRICVHRTVEHTVERRSRIQLPIHDLTAGLYLVQFRNARFVLMKKLVRMK